MTVQAVVPTRTILGLVKAKSASMSHAFRTVSPFWTWESCEGFLQIFKPMEISGHAVKASTLAPDLFDRSLMFSRAGYKKFVHTAQHEQRRLNSTLCSLTNMLMCSIPYTGSGSCCTFGSLTDRVSARCCTELSTTRLSLVVERKFPDA